MTKQDVIDALRLYAVNPEDREVMDGAIEYLLLKFRQDAYERKYERNYGDTRRLLERASDSLSDGVSGRGD